MKKYFFLLAFLLQMGFGNQQLSAQNEDMNNPLDSVVFKKTLGRLEIGYNFFAGKDASMMRNTVRGLGSIKFNYVIQRRIYFDRLYVAPGLGLAINEYRFEKNLLFEAAPNNNLLVYEDTLKNRSYSKTKFQTISLRIPLEFGFQTGKFNLALGGYLDILLGGKHKRIFEQRIGNPAYTEEITALITRRDDLRLRDVYFGLFARIAYKTIGLYAQYNLSPTFDKGPEVQGVQAGISFSQPIYKTRKKRNWMDTLKPRKKNI